MSDNTALVNKVMNSAIKHLEETDIAVSPENQYITIRGWLQAWQSVTDDLVESENELLEALTIAHDRLFCRVLTIQF